VAPYWVGGVPPALLFLLPPSLILSVSHFHVVPVFMLWMVQIETPYLPANFIQSSLAFFISKTFSSVNLAQKTFFPLTGLCLLLEIISFTLSWCVPKNKWSGLTHRLTSHLCRTSIPSPIGPLNNSHETLWDFFEPGENIPYPSLLICPVHNQHELFLLTCLKNLSLVSIRFIYTT
jgi:hypothetical protein